MVRGLDASLGVARGEGDGDGASACRKGRLAGSLDNGGFRLWSEAEGAC